MANKPTARQPARATARGTTHDAMLDDVADHNVDALDDMASEARPTVRQVARPENLPDGAVLGRNGEVLVRKRTGEANQFYIPDELKEPGWSYEWKTETVYGREEVAHQVHLAENGWRVVMAEGRWAGIFMPNGYTGPIRRDGMLLMERPATLTEQAYQEERIKAKNLMRNTHESLRLNTPSGFSTDHAGVKPKTSQTYELGPAPSKRALMPD